MLFMSGSTHKAILATVVCVLCISGIAILYWPREKKTPSPMTPKPSATQSLPSTTPFHPHTIPPSPSTEKSSEPQQTANASGIDIHAIPLGDGKVSSEPKTGYVYACKTSFRNGMNHVGDWIHGNTWDLTKKIFVQGAISWPSAIFSTTMKEDARSLSGNGLPVGSMTGIFPIQQSDPAYQYDRNPNGIKEYTLQLQIPGNPTRAQKPSCLPMGPVGYALNGVAIYNALDDAGLDAVAHEVQDHCSGHPQQAGQYHYHGPSDCMPNADMPATIVGYALDGFGIYSRYDATGREYTNADLDECHGITSQIQWNGKTVTMYHYVLTREYPYTIGCFRGTPVMAQQPSKPMRPPM